MKHKYGFPLFTFILGVITGVVGVFTWQVFRKEAEPREETYSLSEVQKKFFPNRTIKELNRGMTDDEYFYKHRHEFCELDDQIRRWEEGEG